MTKEQALDGLAKSRQALHQTIEGLSVEEMTHAQVEGVWTIKDVVGHITSWEEVVLQPLRRYADGEGYLPLEAGRLSGEELSHLLSRRIDADLSHLIVDACHSYFLAYGRGPGGRRLRGGLPPATGSAGVLRLAQRSGRPALGPRGAGRGPGV